MDRPVKLDLKDKTVCYDLPSKHLTTILFYIYLYDHLIVFSLPLDCKHHEGRNSMFLLTSIHPQLLAGT